LHGSADVVIKEYRSERELVNLINFREWLERELSRKMIDFKREKIIIKRALGFIGPSNDKSFTNKP